MLLEQDSLRHLSGDEPLALLRMIAMEGLIGTLIGTLARLFFTALETMASVLAQLLGLANPFGVEFDSGHGAAPISTLVMLAATALLFAGDFHWEILRGLVASYKAIPLHTDFDAAYSVRKLGEVLGQSFLVAIRVGSPFFLYSVIANFALTLISRVTPQIQVFYVAPPFLIAGGLLLLYFVVKGMLGQFLDGFGAWLTWG
jgi:flagellar biosynthetic protein FliR